MRTPTTFRTHRLRTIAFLLAVALAFVTVPSGARVVITSSASPTFTLDICHPLPGMDRTAATIPLAHPAPAVTRIVLADAGRIVDSPGAKADAFNSAPDPPPPKPRA